MNRLWEEIKEDPGEYAWRCAVMTFCVGIVGLLLAGLVTLFIRFPRTMFIILGITPLGILFILACGLLTYKIDEWQERWENRK